MYCTASFFEVRFKNKQLCICGRITRANTPTFPNCLIRFPLDFTVVISVEKVRSQWGDNCTFRFNFGDNVPIMLLHLGILPGKVVTSSFVNPQPSESLITLYTGNTVSPTRNPPILQSPDCSSVHSAESSSISATWSGHQISANDVTGER
jgi:hypothetical protein